MGSADANLGYAEEGYELNIHVPMAEDGVAWARSINTIILTFAKGDAIFPNENKRILYHAKHH